MSDRQTTARLRRAKLARRTQLLLAILSAGFVLYRIVALFMRHGVSSP